LPHGVILSLDGQRKFAHGAVPARARVALKLSVETLFENVL
jgi:hypothetical protein